MQKVVAFLHAQGPEESRDVDLIAARVALDAISRTGFGYEMGCCEDLGAASEATPYIAALDSGKHSFQDNSTGLALFSGGPVYQM